MERNSGTKNDTESKTFSLSLKGVSTKKSAFDKNLIRDREIIEETDYVTEVSDKTIKSTREAPKKKVFVIPAVKDNNVFQRKLELKYGSNVEGRKKKRLSEGAEPRIKQEPSSPSHDQSDPSGESLPQSATLEDYEQMPVEEFGMAMLRGMGFRPEHADEKEWPKPIEIKLRPKGLGLGAEVQTSMQKEHIEQSKKSNNSATPLIVKSGAYVKILRGAHEGKYGQVEGMDEDAARVHICLAISKEKVSCNEAFVAAVTKEEYNDRGKCLNKATYDDYKQKHDTKNQNDSKFEVSSLAQSDIGVKSKEKEKKKTPETAEKRPFIGYWLRSQIRARIIDEKFKKGKYVNEKVVIEDVLTRDTCLCRTDRGQLLEDVHMDMLETVLPRSNRQSEVPVVVVAGKFKGQMGHIVDRDKKGAQAFVQFESDNEIHKLSFDYICEYAGEL
ncbi:G-patch domain and KOW motifs-containing protein [Galendromus occidentalis]|uniref:G-patch domain and KOW motifs-containing protein n=1 Tax=Galendromus occidentalis TaxID=34638 RepID=A0AAJ6QNB6_9ACAR|nr:G-patch domain and KOW motifs-containing protein [Galendromus occidentalis]